MDFVNNKLLSIHLSNILCDEMGHMLKTLLLYVKGQWLS